MDYLASSALSFCFLNFSSWLSAVGLKQSLPCSINRRVKSGFIRLVRQSTIIHEVSIQRTAFSATDSSSNSSRIVPSAFSRSNCFSPWMSIDNREASGGVEKWWREGEVGHQWRQDEWRRHRKWVNQQNWRCCAGVRARVKVLREVDGGCKALAKLWGFSVEKRVQKKGPMNRFLERSRAHWWESLHFIQAYGRLRYSHSLFTENMADKSGWLLWEWVSLHTFRGRHGAEKSYWCRFYHQFEMFSFIAEDSAVFRPVGKYQTRRCWWFHCICYGLRST